MELTDTQIAWLRAELGDTPSTDDLNAAYERLGSVRDVAIEEVRKRRNRMLDQPLSVNLSGVASVNYAENVKALERRLAALTGLDDDPSDDPGDVVGDEDGFREGGVVQLVRTRRR